MSRHHWLCLISCLVRFPTIMLTACTIRPVTRLAGQAASSPTEAASAQPVTVATAVPTHSRLVTPGVCPCRWRCTQLRYVCHGRITTYPGGSFRNDMRRGRHKPAQRVYGVHCKWPENRNRDALCF